MTTRRRELVVGVAAASASMVLSCKAPRAPQAKAEEQRPPASDEDKVTPVEDLMREHGVLSRALLVYDECARRLESGAELPPAVIPATARIVRQFVHEYHEAIEEEAVFPRCERALAHLTLVRTLREQHVVGRKITAFIEQAVGGRDRRRLVGALRAFGRMYRPHAAREDTVLFPALRGLVVARDLDAMGDQLEARERALFGVDGFERKLAEIADLETTLEINDLARVTPTEFR
jgi:hemerythrin-like domain-containing protein